MSTNYNKFFIGNNNQIDDETKVEEVEFETITEVIKTDDIEETITTETAPEVHPDIIRAETTELPKEEGELPKPLYGINNCKKLNVRTEPSKDSELVCILDSKSTFEIEELESDPQWVKVFLDNGEVGFCMKMYVAVKGVK